MVPVFDPYDRPGVSVTAFAPGRVNLIGEHTDYNDGLALPFAIEQGVSVTATAIGGRLVEAVVVESGERDTFDPASTAAVPGWRAFVRGVAAELAGEGVELPGVRLEIAGTVPQGAGLSSSAALAVAASLALLAVAGKQPHDRVALARLCSRVENEWVGAHTGLLDQLASLFGEADRALRIDFRSLQLDPVALELGSFRLVALDSGESHALAESGYNDRREECAEACRRLGIASLREATMALAAELPDPLNRRVEHVVAENERVEQTVAALAAGELQAVGELLNDSHASLRDLYEVSTAEVERTRQTLCEEGAVGARIMGGGFGGSVLGLFPQDASPPAGATEVRPGPGARLLA